MLEPTGVEPTGLEPTENPPPPLTTSGPAIPGQRMPLHDALPPGVPPKKPHRGKSLLVVAALAALAVAVVPGPDPHGASIAQTVVPVSPASPAEIAEKDIGKVLTAQSAALVRGDQTGWLAAVDPAQPALRKRYRDLYRSLRALRVTKFHYETGALDLGGGQVKTNASIEYCLARPAKACSDPALIGQRLTLKKGAKGYVISRLDRDEDNLETPWESGSLIFAQGKRVTVGAPASLRKHLSEVVRIADRSATVNDRVARTMKNPQQRYRIFLATDKTWKSWYGGDLPRYSTAYAIPLNQSGSDVVLRMSDLDDDAEDLKVTIQHEMAHVAILSNLDGTDSNDDLWLTEGVAEYVGWLPLRAGPDLTMPSLAKAFRGSSRPKSIVQKPIAGDSDDRKAGLFYGFGHFSVSCMVVKFGESRTMKFVRLKLREAKSLDAASRSAFGKPFATVDKSCVSWIAQNA
jgi:hypothetical protein